MNATNTQPWMINEEGSVVYRLNDQGINSDDLLIRQAEGEYHDKEKMRALGQQVLILLNSVPSRVTPEMWMALGKGQALIDRATQSAQERKLLVIEASQDEVMNTQFVRFVKQLEAQLRSTQAWVAQYEANQDAGSKRNAAHSLGRIAGMMLMHSQLFGSEEKFKLPEPVQAAVEAQNEYWSNL